MHSLRRRLLIGTALGTAMVLLGSGIALYLMTRASLLRELDAALFDKAATLAALIELEGDQVDLEFTEAQLTEFDRPDRPEYFQVWDAHGTVVGRSPSLGAGGSVRIQAARSNGTVCIRIANSGSHIRAEDTPRVFDRFWRGDSARAKDGTHCGLGLALCKTIVGRLGSAIDAESSAGGDFSVTITL